MLVGISILGASKFFKSHLGLYSSHPFNYNFLKCDWWINCGQCKTQTGDKMQTVDCRPGVKFRLRVKCRLRLKCRLQTRRKVQTEGNADCRLEVKFRLRVK